MGILDDVRLVYEAGMESDSDIYEAGPGWSWAAVDLYNAVPG